MPEYLHPGVYIQEVSGGRPIEGVSTSTVGFVGRALKGPEGTPTLVTSFLQFQRIFGPTISNPSAMGDYLGHAVLGFFNNLGQRAYIVRVLGAGALAASTDSSTPQLGNGVAIKLTATVRGSTNLLPVNTLRTVSNGASVAIFTRADVDSPWTAFQTVQVLSYDVQRSTITLTPATALVGVTLDSGNTYLTVVGAAPTSHSGVTPSFIALSRGLAGNDIAVQISPQDLTPARLTTSSFVRAPVTLATFPGTGPGPAAFTSIALPSAAMRRVRTGDTVTLNSNAATLATLTVGSVAAATVHLSLAGGPAGDYSAATSVTLTSRGGTALKTAYAFTGAGLDLTGLTAAGSDLTVPHAVAATLQSGDVLTFTGVPGTATVTVGTITLATAIPVPSTTGDYTSGTLALTVSPGRLFVNSLAGLTVPNNSPVDALNVTSGTDSASTNAQLIDVSLGVIFYSGGSFPSGLVTDGNWQSVEDLVVVAPGGSTLPVSTTAPFYTGAIVLVDDGTHAPTQTTVTAVSATAKTITVANPITAGITVSATATARQAFVRVIEFSVQIFEEGTQVETFTNLSWNPDPLMEAYRKFYINAVNDPNAGSAYVKIGPALHPPTSPDLTNLPATLDGFPLELGGGSDGAVPINIDIIGQDNGPGARTGIQALKEPDDIALIAAPGITDVAVQEELITQCEILKYRFAVLDGRPDQSDVSQILSHRYNYDSEYAAYYEPWLETLDLTTGNTVQVPPSGHVLGIYARSDNNRGVHKAPANEVVNSITGIEFNFTNGEQDVLNPVGVNLIRSFTGRGIRVWGARTISSDGEWKYINVRRLFIFLEHSIDNGTQWVVFEPNNEALWAKVVATITAFLVSVWKTGALMGTKPEDAFFVKCDRSTMTENDIENGRLVCIIGVAPTFPAEFVIFQIGQFTASATQS
jgi:phage tail sheath protein FI